MAERTFINYKRVLIVDDEPDVLETLEQLLPMCDVVKASTFEEARELLEIQYFDIAILDIMGVNGYRLLEIAKQREVITVMLTAHALSPEDLAKSYKQGADSYVPKEEMASIVTFLNDVLEAREQGKHPWSRWLDRLGAYFDNKFGPAWKDDEEDLWDKFARFDV
jgi:DNA-binding response OmpR family regulator